MGSDKYHEIIIWDNVTILSSLFTYFDFDLWPNLNFNVYSAFICMINILSEMKKLFLEIMNRLVHNMIHRLVWFCWWQQHNQWCAW